MMILNGGRKINAKDRRGALLHKIHTIYELITGIFNMMMSFSQELLCQWLVPLFSHVNFNL